MGEVSTSQSSDPIGAVISAEFQVSAFVPGNETVAPIRPPKNEQSSFHHPVIELPKPQKVKRNLWAHLALLKSLISLFRTKP